MSQPHLHLLTTPDPSGLNFFAALPTPVWERLDGIKELRSYADGSWVYHQDQLVEGIFQLAEGEWKEMHTDARGYQQVLAFLRPGAVTGIIPFFEGRPSGFGVRSLKRSRGFHIPGESIRRWALTEPAGVDAVLRFFGGGVRHLMDVAHGLSLLTVPERLAKVLLTEHQRRPDSPLLEFREDQGELGLHMGCTRAAVSRAFKLLADMGLIRNTFPVVKLLDLPTLQRMAGSRTAPVDPPRIARSRALVEVARHPS
ncbi:MAG TPA: Crp/Fnr family transcriptional regulator [Holophagaceae bacterium]|nr:Crp/Fnr family transcriptional regulator [Holophagaceae bacterium]